MKNKQHFNSVHIEYIRYSDSLFKIRIVTFYHNDELCQFFIPRKKGQSPIDIDPKVIQYRARKDFGITFDHNSATYK